MTAVPLLPPRALAGDRFAIVLRVVGAIGVGVVSAVLAVMADPLVAMSVAGGFVLVVFGARWPLLPLFLFVVLIPIEETVNITGFGTLSRWAGIVFALVYAVPRLGRLAPTALPVAGWAFIGWAALSALWAIAPGTATGQLPTLIQLAVVAFLISDLVIRDPSIIRPLLWAYSTSAAATAAIGIGMYLLGGVASDDRAAALAGQNPAQFATLLLPALIFGLHEALQGRRVLAAGLVTLLSTAAIALSGTRSVWLAATVVIFFLVLPRLGAPPGGLRARRPRPCSSARHSRSRASPSLVADRTETATSTGGAGRTDIWSVGLQIIEIVAARRRRLRQLPGRLHVGAGPRGERHLGHRRQRGAPQHRHRHDRGARGRRPRAPRPASSSRSSFAVAGGRTPSSSRRSSPRS